MKKFVTIVLSILMLFCFYCTSEAKCLHYETHEDTVYPYNEIKVGDEFLIEDPFTVYYRANGSKGAKKTTRSQVVKVVNKYKSGSDHPIQVKGDTVYGWTDLSNFTKKVIPSAFTYDEVEMFNQYIFKGDKIFRYAESSKRFDTVDSEMIVQVCEKYSKKSLHPIQVYSVRFVGVDDHGDDIYEDDSRFYGWVDLSDLFPLE